MDIQAIIVHLLVIGSVVGLYFHFTGGKPEDTGCPGCGSNCVVEDPK